MKKQEKGMLLIYVPTAIVLFWAALMLFWYLPVVLAIVLALFACVVSMAIGMSMIEDDAHEEESALAEEEV